MDDNTGNKGLDGAMEGVYGFLAQWADFLPPAFALLGLFLCIRSGFAIYQCVYTRDGGIDIDDHQVPKHMGAFVLGALLGISAIVTYQVGSVF